MKPIERNKPWKSKVTYVDVATGEIITAKKAKQFKIKKLVKKISYGEENFNIIEKHYNCTYEQLRLF